VSKRKKGVGGEGKGKGTSKKAVRPLQADCRTPVKKEWGGGTSTAHLGKSALGGGKSSLLVGRYFQPIRKRQKIGSEVPLRRLRKGAEARTVQNWAKRGERKCISGKLTHSKKTAFTLVNQGDPDVTYTIIALFLDVLRSVTSCLGVIRYLLPHLDA